MCVMVVTLCVFTVLSNGTDWFLGGLLWILIVPVLYILSKRIQGINKLKIIIEGIDSHNI
ncbi:MAG: hypothetical protein ACOX4J_03440 [Anaerovoracaceae bacterium]|jgi:hypothetical protein